MYFVGILVSCINVLQHRICTMIIFNATAQHAVSNFGQYDIEQFVPNNPFSMRLPVHKKGEVSDTAVTLS